MLVKVCGIKSSLNLRDISKIGVDMVGFNFFRQSPRYMEEKSFPLPNHLKKVGVFVNATIDEIQEKISAYQLDFVQLHGDETLSFTMDVHQIIPTIKVFRIGYGIDSTCLNEYSFCHYFLFDTASRLYGGSGVKFDWNMLKSVDVKVPFFLSGGIGPEDVTEILNLKRQNDQFAGIDINSKFETFPGFKDIQKISQFLKNLGHSNPEKP
jgi:phosphoribosylanthranilate isomerase